MTWPDLQQIDPVIAKFHYTGPTRPDQTRVSDKVRGLCPVGSGRARVVEFSYYTKRSSVTRVSGDAENARHEIAGHENAAPECKGGKCETWKCGTRMQGWKMRDMKMRETRKYGTPRVAYVCPLHLHKLCCQLCFQLCCTDYIFIIPFCSAYICHLEIKNNAQNVTPALKNRFRHWFNAKHNTAFLYNIGRAGRI